MVHTVIVHTQPNSISLTFCFLSFSTPSCLYRIIDIIVEVVSDNFLLHLLLTTGTCMQRFCQKPSTRVFFHSISPKSNGIFLVPPPTGIVSSVASNLSSSRLSASQSNCTLSTFSSIRPKWRSIYQRA